MDERGALLPICTGGHMSDLLIDAQLHFFQKLHDHRVVIKLPSKYHNTIHNHLTLLYSLLLQCLFLVFFFFYTCLKLLDLLLLHFSKLRLCQKSINQQNSSSLQMVSSLAQDNYTTKNYISTIYQLVKNSYFLETNTDRRHNFILKRKKFHSKFNNNPFLLGCPGVAHNSDRCSGCPSLPIILLLSKIGLALTFFMSKDK